jgi:hypothetical protein
VASPCSYRVEKEPQAAGVASAVRLAPLAGHIGRWDGRCCLRAAAAAAAAAAGAAAAGARLGH